VLPTLNSAAYDAVALTLKVSRDLGSNSPPVPGTRRVYGTLKRIPKADRSSTLSFAVLNTLGRVYACHVFQSHGNLDWVVLGCIILSAAVKTKRTTVGSLTARLLAGMSILYIELQQDAWKTAGEEGRAEQIDTSKKEGRLQTSVWSERWIALGRKTPCSHFVD